MSFEVEQDLDNGTGGDDRVDDTLATAEVPAAPPGGLPPFDGWPKDAAFANAVRAARGASGEAGFSDPDFVVQAVGARGKLEVNGKALYISGHPPTNVKNSAKVDSYHRLSAMAAPAGGSADTGALLVLRAACLAPEKVASWCVANAVIDPEYRGHQTARIWATPVLGELSMLAIRNKRRLEKALVEGGMPAALARREVPHIDRAMRQSILKLYRSAEGLRFHGAWVDDLAKLPRRGQVFWGEADAFVRLEVAERFARRWDIPLHVERGAGHWACNERAQQLAGVLRAHWAQ